MRLYAYAAAVGVILAAAYFTVDAIGDAREAELRAGASDDRLDDIEQDREGDADARALDDAGLFDRASQWLRGADSPD